VFLRDGKASALYSTFRNPDLADAYRLLQRRGRDAFYEGPIADAILERLNDSDALPWRRSDLRRFHSEWIDPITTNYKGYDVYEMPPEAKKLAYSDLLRYNGDPRFVDVPLDRLLSKGLRRVAVLANRPEAGLRAVGRGAHKGRHELVNMIDLGMNVYDLVGAQLQTMGHTVNRTTGDPMGGYFQRLMNSAAAGFTSSGFEALRKCWPPSTTRSSAPGLLTNSPISSSALATE
jgi:hypothetical protein